MKKAKQFKLNKSNGKQFSLAGNEKENSRGKGYDKTWKKYRYKFLYYNPSCYACGREANTVDHIRAHKGDKELFWNEKNYIPMCHSCHSVVTGLFDKYRKPKTEEKMKWLQRQREIYEVTIRVKVVGFGRLKREIARSRSVT